MLQEFVADNHPISAAKHDTSGPLQGETECIHLVGELRVLRKIREVIAPSTTKTTTIHVSPAPVRSLEQSDELLVGFGALCDKIQPVACALLHQSLSSAFVLHRED